MQQFLLVVMVMVAADTQAEQKVQYGWSELRYICRKR